MTTEFGEAQALPDGSIVQYNGEPLHDWPWPTTDDVETVYVERRVPSYLEDQAHAAMDQFLRGHGHNPDEI